MEVHAFRLTPGEDLKKALCAYAASRKLRASFVLTCVGSLRAVTLRLANRARDGKNEIVSLDERFEIVSLTGTVSAHGAHLHVSIADFEGNVVGGHLMDGCVVFTTAEIVLGESATHVFAREMDARTGFDELVVSRREDPPLSAMHALSIDGPPSSESGGPPSYESGPPSFNAWSGNDARASRRGSAASGDGGGSNAHANDAGGEAHASPRNDWIGGGAPGSGANGTGSGLARQILPPPRHRPPRPRSRSPRGESRRRGGGGDASPPPSPPSRVGFFGWVGRMIVPPPTPTPMKKTRAGSSDGMLEEIESGEGGSGTESA
jgi:predicted DNA-binding protein with PD1-like motif